MLDTKQARLHAPDRLHNLPRSFFLPSMNDKLQSKNSFLRFLTHTMPPKKVPPPPSATGDEGTPSKQDAVFREGINIEVFMEAKFEVVPCPAPYR